MNGLFSVNLRITSSTTAELFIILCCMLGINITLCIIENSVFFFEWWNSNTAIDCITVVYQLLFNQHLKNPRNFRTFLIAQLSQVLVMVSSSSKRNRVK